MSERTSIQSIRSQFVGMPSLDGQNGGAIVPYTRPSSDSEAAVPVVHTVHHGMKVTPRVLVTWGPGNVLRLSYLGQLTKEAEKEKDERSIVKPGCGPGKVVELKLGKKDDRAPAEKRGLAYSSVQAFAFLQSQKQQLMQSSDGSSYPVSSDWWQAVLEYSQNISTSLGPTAGPPGSATDFSGYSTKARNYKTVSSHQL